MCACGGDACMHPVCLTMIQYHQHDAKRKKVDDDGSHSSSPFCMSVCLPVLQGCHLSRELSRPGSPTRSRTHTTDSLYMYVRMYVHCKKTTTTLPPLAARGRWVFPVHYSKCFLGAIEEAPLGSSSLHVSSPFPLPVPKSKKKLFQHRDTDFSRLIFGRET